MTIVNSIWLLVICLFSVIESTCYYSASLRDTPVMKHSSMVRAYWDHTELPFLIVIRLI